MADIILIEDDPSVAILIGDILLMKGYSVRIFSRGNDFIGTIPEQCPAIVISDYQLPDLPVADLFQAIQERYTPEIPRFIIISARSKTEVDWPIIERFKALFIEKPFRLREFIKSIEENY
jgi:two-component system response regulator TrcR